MKRWMIPAALACVALLRNPLEAQAPTAAFEVVSVKLDSNPAAQMGIRPVMGNRFSAVMTAKALIMVSYGARGSLLENQVVGAPSWTGTDRYEINATFDGPITSTGSSSADRLMAMIRTLLADRFKLRLHTETRQVPVFDLVMANADSQPGPRLVKAPGTCVRVSGALPANVDFSTLCGFKPTAGGTLLAKGIDLGDLASALSQRPEVQRIVHNRTGLAGDYDVDLEYTPFAGGDAQPGPGLTTALREQLGLTLRSATGPVEMFVVDSVERPAPD